MEISLHGLSVVNVVVLGDRSMMIVGVFVHQQQNLLLIWLQPIQYQYTHHPQLSIQSSLIVYHYFDQAICSLSHQSYKPNYMILSYNWQILDRPIADEKQLSEKAYSYRPVSQDSFNSQEDVNVSVNPTILKQPEFGFLFCYHIEQPKSNAPEIQLQTAITLLQAPIRHKVTRHLKTPTCIYLQIEIENTQIYQSLMTLIVKIRYHIEDKLPKIQSIDQVVRLASQRQINLYTATTYSTIKKDIIVESPVSAQWRQQKEGYLYLKLSKNEQYGQQVQILEVQVMNWLSQREQIRRQVVKNMLREALKLRVKQSLGLLFMMQNSIMGEQIPYYIIFRVDGCQKSFKMVKHISLFEYK